MTSSIESRLNALDFTHKLGEVNNVLNDPQIQTRVTFWGTRVIELPDQGSVSFSELFDRVFQATSNIDNLTSAQRIAGIEVARKLQNFHRLTEEQLGASNWLTKLFNYIREVKLYIPEFASCLLFSWELYVPRNPEYPIIKNCKTYSATQFTQEFGVLSEEGSHPALEETYEPIPVKLSVDFLVF